MSAHSLCKMTIYCWFAILQSLLSAEEIVCYASGLSVLVTSDFKLFFVEYHKSFV